MPLIGVRVRQEVNIEDDDKVFYSGFQKFIFLQTVCDPCLIFGMHRPLSISFSYMQPRALDMAPRWGKKVLILKFLVYVC